MKTGDIVLDSERKFLRELLKWDGCASSSNLLFYHLGKANHNARQSCKRRGYVTYEGGYWRITDKGREAALS